MLLAAILLIEGCGEPPAQHTAPTTSSADCIKPAFAPMKAKPLWKGYVLA